MHPLLWAVCLLLLTGIRDPEVKAFVVRLEARYHSSRTLQATFLQRYMENGRQVRAEAGKVYFRRPGKMRWEYDSPEPDLFVVDGKMAWFYVPADRTVTRVPAKESTDWRTPFALLAGEMKVSRVCDEVRLAEQEAPQSQANVMLYCTLRGTEPRRSSSGRSKNEPAHAEAGDGVYLEVVKDAGDLVRVLVKNAGSITIEFRFANWRFDPPVQDSLFRFVVPHGVAIVNGELPSGQNLVKP